MLLVESTKKKERYDQWKIAKKKESKFYKKKKR